jgi:hypothetical protein
MILYGMQCPVLYKELNRSANLLKIVEGRYGGAWPQAQPGTQQILAKYSLCPQPFSRHSVLVVLGS